MPFSGPSSIIVDGEHNRFELVLDAGRVIEIRIERWARCTTGKRYWARWWTPGRPKGPLYADVVARAREELARQRRQNNPSG